MTANSDGVRLLALADRFENDNNCPLLTMSERKIVAAALRAAPVPQRDAEPVGPEELEKLIADRSAGRAADAILKQYRVVPLAAPARCDAGSVDGPWRVEVGYKGSGPWDRLTIETGPSSGGLVIATINKMVPEAEASARLLVETANFATAEAMIANAPQILKDLGSRLADLLDADHWNNIEPMLLELATALATPPALPAGEEVRLDPATIEECAQVADHFAIITTQTTTKERDEHARERARLVAQAIRALSPSSNGKP